MTLTFCIFSIRASEPILLGRAEMPSLTAFLNSAAPFMEKLSPGLSAKLLLGATALAFAPDFKDFDITEHAALYIYAMPSAKNKEPLSVIVLSKKADQLPAQMQITGQQLFTKASGGKIMLSESKEILDALTKLPEEMKLEDNQIKVSFLPAEYIKHFPQDFQELRRELVKGIASAGKRRLDVNGVKVLNLKLAYAEKAIEQIESISLTLSADKEIIHMDISFSAQKGSAFEQFITAQKNSVSLYKEPRENKLISAAGHIEMTEPLRKTLSEIADGIAVEEADDESQMKYVSTLQLLFKTFNGSFSFYMDTLPSQDNKRFTVTTLKMQDEKAAAAILKSLSETSKKIDNGTYSMTSVLIGPQTESKIICAVDGQDVKILSGSLSEKEASEQFAISKEQNPKDHTGDSCIALIGKTTPSTALINFKDSNALISLDLTPETLKPVLPDTPLLAPPSAPQKKPGQKKSKKNRIQLNPADFMKTR